MNLDNQPDLLQSIYGITVPGENILLKVSVGPMPQRPVLPCDNYGIRVLSQEEMLGQDIRTIYHVKGYLSPYVTTMYPLDYDPKRDPAPATTTCQAFKISPSDSQKIFENKYESIAIDRNTLSPTQDRILTQSNQNSLVTLSFKNKTPPERDLNYCESLIDIISVEK